MAKVLLLVQLIIALVLLPLGPGIDGHYLPLGLMFLGLVLAVPAATVSAVFGLPAAVRALADAWSVLPLGARGALSVRVWSLASKAFPVGGVVGGLIAFTGALTSFAAARPVLEQAAVLALFGLTWAFLGLLLSRVLEQIVARLSAPRTDRVVSLRAEVARLWALTPRETEAAQAVLDGLTYQGAAEKLGIAAATVKSHLLSVYQKSGTGNKIELLRLVEAETRRIHQTVDGRAGRTGSESGQEESS